MWAADGHKILASSSFWHLKKHIEKLHPGGKHWKFGVQSVGIFLWKFGISEYTLVACQLYIHYKAFGGRHCLLHALKRKIVNIGLTRYLHFYVLWSKYILWPYTKSNSGFFSFLKIRNPFTFSYAVIILILFWAQWLTNGFLNNFRMDVSMLYTLHHLFTLTQNMLQMSPGQPRLKISSRESINLFFGGVDQHSSILCY